MFQQPLLFPHLSVADNLGFGLPACVKGESRKAQIEEALAIAGLEGMGGRDPETLSGGQQARIALLRTLLAKPEALLLDEPFSSLDDSRRTQIVSLVQREAQRLNLPVLLVSHDPRDVDAATNSVVELETI
jgi:putative thiamine transport system ATP-binding protein